MTIGRSMAVTAALVSAIGVAIAADSGSTATPREAIYVSNGGGNYVTIYAVGSSGDVEPAYTIDGAATGLNEPMAIAVDSSGKIYVLNESGGPRNSGSVVLFAAGSKGNVSPIATISGSDAGLFSPKAIAVDSKGNIYVSNEGGIPPGPNIERPGGVAIYPPGSNGNVKPSAMVRGADVNMQLPCADTCCGNDTGIQNPFGIAVDPRATIFVTTTSGCPQRLGESVRVFPAGSNGNVRPGAVISGANTGLDSPAGVAVDPRGNIYVANAGGYGVGRSGFPTGIRIYTIGTNGNVPPIATISGSNTGLSGRNVRGIALDSKENIYITSDGRDGMESSITVFKAGSNGNVKPIAVIGGDNTGLSGAGGIAIGPYPDTR